MGTLDKKVGDFKLGRALGVGISKSISEQVLAPVIGNGTFTSALIKIVSAWGAPKLVRKVTSNDAVNTTTARIAEGMAIDAVEDGMNAIFSDSKGRMVQESGAVL